MTFSLSGYGGILRPAIRKNGLSILTDTFFLFSRFEMVPQNLMQFLRFGLLLPAISLFVFASGRILNSYLIGGTVLTTVLDQ